MDSTLAGPNMPKFRAGVRADVGATAAALVLGERHCRFEFAEREAPAVARLFDDLKEGGLTQVELAARAHEIGAHLPHLLEEFDGLRLLSESDPARVARACSGAQLYREVRRVAERTGERVAKSSFYNALVEQRATREQLIGYALEYHWIVLCAPGLIGPALGMAHSQAESALLQDFLRSELGHDRFLSAALKSVGVTQQELALHQPLPATFALCASLGVYARQHQLSFKACLFLFERAQPAFIDAFDARCQALGLPEAFHAPLRAHADLNNQYDHEDISRSLMELEPALDAECCAVVKRHVSIMVETMIGQEEQILTFYGWNRDRIPRIFE
jgi:hypothetical protein